MGAKLLLNLLFLIFINFLVKPFWLFGIDRGVQNAVGNEEYGIYYALFNLGFALNVILDPGITIFNNRNIAQNHHLLEKYFSGIFTIKCFLSILYLLAVLSLGLFLGYYTYLYLLLPIAINQALSSFILYMRSNISALQHFKTEGMISVMDRLLMIIICGFLLFTPILEGRFKITYFVMAQMVSYALTALVAFLWLRTKTDTLVLRINLKFNFLLLILKKSYPFAILGLLMVIYNRVDSIMLERMLPEGAKAAGIYAAAYRILDAVNMVGFIFSTILLPTFAKMLKEKYNFIPLLNTASQALFIPALCLCLWAHQYDFELMDLLYKDEIAIKSAVFGNLIFTFIPICVVYVFGSLLTANADIKALNTISGFGVLLNIAMNFYFIPQFGVSGAVWTTLVTQSMVALLHLILAVWVFKLPVRFSFVLRYLLLVGGTVWLFQFSVEGFSWWLDALSKLLLVLSFALLLRIVEVKQLLVLLKHAKSAKK